MFTFFFFFFKIYNLRDKAPVTGLFIGQFPGTQSSPKYFLVVTTPTKIYQFIGGPTYENIFINYETPNYQDMPGDLNYSELHFYRRYQDSLPEFFCWMIAPGLYYGNLTFGSQNAGDQILTDTLLLQYPRETVNEVGPAVGSVLTEFHFIVGNFFFLFFHFLFSIFYLLFFYFYFYFLFFIFYFIIYLIFFFLFFFYFFIVFKDRMQVLSRFSEQVVFTQIFPYELGDVKVNNYYNYFLVYSHFYLFIFYLFIYFFILFILLFIFFFFNFFLIFLFTLIVINF